MKTILIFTLLTICIVTLSNCNKEEIENIVNQVNVTIKNSHVYELDLMISGDEERGTIQTQAKHFQKSELIRDSSTNWSFVYKYEPHTSYTGTDFVEIETCTEGESTGCSNTEILRINFIITN